MKLTPYILVGGIVVLGIAVASSYFIGQHEGTTQQQGVTQNASSPSAEGTGSTGSTAATNPTGVASGSPTPAGHTSVAGSGVVFTFSDNISALSALQGITLTLNTVSVYSSTKGWVSVTSSPTSLSTYGQSANDIPRLFANVALSPGTYSAIRFSIASVSIQGGNGLPSSTAYLASQQMQMPISLIVTKGQMSGLSLNFNSSRSLFKTTDSSYVYFPIVTAVTHHMLDKVQTLGGNTQMIGGYTDFTQTWGMDANGQLAANFSYPVFAGVNQFTLIGRTIEIIPLNGTSAASITPEAAIRTALDGGYFATATSIELKTSLTPIVWEVDGFKNESLVRVFIDAKTGTLSAVR